MYTYYFWLKFIICIAEIFKISISNRLLSTKSPFEFLFLNWEFTKVILWSKSWCEMFVLKHSGIQISFISKFKIDDLMFVSLKTRQIVFIRTKVNILTYKSDLLWYLKFLNVYLYNVLYCVSLIMYINNISNIICFMKKMASL